METEDTIVNRVAQSGLVTLDLEDFYPKERKLVFDIRDTLGEFEILREKDFRNFLNEHDWTQYDNCLVSVVNTSDAIVPMWAFMLVISKLVGHATFSVVGSLETLEALAFERNLRNHDFGSYAGKRVVLKGCGSYPVPGYGYGEATRLLLGVAQSVMYGEPCSTVPVYRHRQEGGFLNK